MSVFESLDRASRWLDSHGGESKGIHRYLAEERGDGSLARMLLKVCGLWISGCGGLTSMSSYFLGPLIFGLGYRDTLLYGILGTLVGCVVAAYTATMGPRSGLRQMCSARYLFGPWMVRIVALITVVGFLGWSVTNNVLGGEIISYMANGKVSLSLGIVIVAIISLIVALFGIYYLLKFETYVGLAVILAVFLMYIIAGPEISQYHSLQTLPGMDEVTKIGERISFFTLAYSVTATWGGCAADYYVLLPESVSQSTIFVFTFFATAIPTIFGAVLGMLIGNAAIGYPLWYNEYETESLGGLLNMVFDRWHGFGKFLLIVFWLSLITNNTINNYSSALSVQLMDNFFYKHFPRWFIVIIIFVITLVCSLVGRNSFSTILSNFLPMLGYWISIYATLLFEENVIFRSTRLAKLYRYELYGEKVTTEVTEIVDKKAEAPTETVLDDDKSFPPPCATTKGAPYYNFNVWNDTEYHTHGIASTLAFLTGVTGVVLGMNQVYYIGVIARKVGDYGADLGMLLSIGFTAVSYPPLRYFELNKFGK